MNKSRVFKGNEEFKKDFFSFYLMLNVSLREMKVMY